eukprot:gene19543-23369_t
MGIPPLSPLRALDLISSEEVVAVVAAIRDSSSPEAQSGLRFMECHLADPDPDHVGHLGDSWVVPDVQPPTSAEEYEEVENAVKIDRGVIEALRRRDITDMRLIMVDPWLGPDDNGYSRPVEGIHVVVDLQSMRVISVHDEELVPIPPPDPLRNYIGERVPGALPLKPLSVVQPEGPSYHVREGLVLHSLQVYDADKDEVRMVAHRMSFVEMVVPYGATANTVVEINVAQDPAGPQNPHRNGFGVHETKLERELEGRRCCSTASSRHWEIRSSTKCIKNAVCLHEEDHGLLWKHVNWRTGHTASMRSRRLVISFFCTVANYEYGFFFYLYMDGTVQSEVKLTGVQHGPNRPIPTDELSPQALSILAGGLARA